MALPLDYSHILLLYFPTFSDACLVWHNSLFLLPVAWIIGTIMTYYIVMRTLLESFTNSRLQSQLSVMDL